MINQIVQWTLLPTGPSPDGFLTASLFVAPRLRSDEGTTLAQFTDFLDWPSQLGAHFSIKLQREDGATTAPRQVQISADTRLWQALFPHETLVRPFAFDDYADRPIVTYPVLGVLAHLRDRWARLAREALDDLPLSSRNAAPIGPAIDFEVRPGPVLSDHFGTLRDVLKSGIMEGVENAAQFSQRLEDTLASAAREAARVRQEHNLAPQPMIEPFGGQGTGARGSIYQLMGFHRRPEREPVRFPAGQAEAYAEISEKMEFHHLVSSLGDHPSLLRQLGLVIDLEFPSDFLPVRDVADPPGMVRVLVERASTFPTRDDPEVSPWNRDVFPWTRCYLADTDAGAVFAAARRPTAPMPHFTHGLLKVPATQFSAVAVDVDGLALKALNMAATLNRHESSDRPIEEPAQAGVPTPRTGGIGLIQAGHGSAMHLDFYQARANNDQLEGLDPEDPPVLGAEDLVRGYRLDVEDVDFSGQWRSLTQRRAAYIPLRAPDRAFEIDDEGMFQVSVTSEVDRPDNPADPDGALYAHEALLTWDGWSHAAPRPEKKIPQEPPAPEGSTDLGPLNLNITVSARLGSLPQLRFGRSYRVRVRTVDLAGNSLSMERASDITQVFADTVLPPEPLVYRRFEPVPPPELVRRRPFGPGEGLERLVIRSNLDISAADYAAASQEASDPLFRYVDFCDRHVAPAKSSLQLAELHGMFDEAFAAVQGLAPVDAAAAIVPFYAVAARENGSFPETLDADSVELPYLPDPYCRGVVMRISFDTDSPEERHDIVFARKGEWHELHPFRIRLAEGGPSFEPPDGLREEYTIRVPTGRTAQMRINSLFEGDPETLGITDWCRTVLGDANVVVEAIKDSRHWMVTPWRTVELIHASQQPLQEPQSELLLDPPGNFARSRSDAVARLAGNIFIDAPSTARIDLVADWEETIDDLSQHPLDDTKMVHPIHAQVFSINVPEPFGTPWSDEIAPLLAMEDRQLIRFNTVDPEQQGVEVYRRNLLAQSVAAPTPQERHRLAAAAAQIETLRAHDFGDTRYRRVHYQTIAATRFREYFDPELPKEAGIRHGNTETVEMLSSAEPPVPVVLDVVPLLRWDEDGSLATGLTSTRHGKGLRVWLQRPWFRTGAGELLGVICNDSGAVGTNSPDYREVTYIARDPLHGGPLPLPLGRDRFKGAAVSLNAIEVMTQLGRTVVSMLGFEPKYDPVHDAWYCDLWFETGETYFPFVRLGLVRYQPKSIPHCEISRVTPTYFIQPLPDRAMTVTQAADSSFRIVLCGAAPESRRNAPGEVENETNLVVATIEHQDARITDPSLGWEATGVETILTAQVVDGVTTWTGTVPAPEESDQLTRICIREFEIHPTDLGETRRLVHADVVVLD